MNVALSPVILNSFQDPSRPSAKPNEVLKQVQDDDSLVQDKKSLVQDDEMANGN